MNEQEYIEGIVTLIKNYRRTELKKPLDAAHVKRWLNQFEAEEQSIVLRETFHALARYYIKKEQIYDFLDQLLEKLIAENGKDHVVFASVQKKGYSQKLMYKYISEKGNFVFQSENFTDG